MQKIIKNIKKHKILVVIFIVIIFSLSLISKIYKFNFKYKTSENTSRMEAIIENLEKVEEDKISYLVKYNGDKFLLNIYKDKYSLEKTNDKQFNLDFKYGDVVTFRGKISIPEKLGNEGEFNYKNYLNSNNIVGIISTYDVKVTDVKLGNIFLNCIYYIKESISKKIDNMIPKNEVGLFKSMIYGDDLDLDSNVKENFKKVGLSHLLVVSGTHMSSVIILLSYIYRFINKKNNMYINIFVIIVFCILSSSGLSIIRAAIMILISVIFTSKNKNINIYVKIFISLVIICIYNPYAILSSGIMLSYFSVLGIVMFQTEIFSFFKIKVKYILKIEYVKPKGIKKVIYNAIKLILFPLSITISVQIMLFPVQLYLFGDFYFVTFLSNILVSYIINFFSVISYIYILCINIPYLSGMLANFIILILKLIINLTEYLSSFDMLKISIPRLSIISYIIYYLIVLLYKFRKYIKLNLSKKIKKHFNKIIFVFTFLGFTFVISNYIYINYFENYVYYFNVKQGNMALIHKNGKNIVVDMGSTTENLASNILLNFAKVRNISKIDLVILTHMHTDHINGVNSILDNIPVERVAYNIPKEEIKEYYELKNNLDKNGIIKLELEESDKISFDDIDIQILGPPKDKEIKSSDSVNANSMIIYITTQKSSLLFMGDATKESEEYLLENNENITNIDVLQIGHHGSSTSTSDKLLENINIKNGLISSCKKVYGHPSDVTLNILKKHNINIWITENKGGFKYKI